VRVSLLRQLILCAAFTTAPAWAADKPATKHKPATTKPSREASNRPSAGQTRARSTSVKPSLPASQRHRVAPGETLSHIALRYGSSVDALVEYNSLDKARPLQLGQLISLPLTAKLPPKSWHPYAKSPKKRGHLEVFTPFARFEGQALDADGRLRSPAVKALNNLLGAGGTHPTVPERLIRLLAQVSDTFGGRPLRVVSGFRRNSYFQDSRHKLSSAVDFVVVGVPNTVLCDYLRELEDVGVGYYPNSTFVHLDVRGQSAYWVDYAGPGEPPRSTPNAPAAPRRPDRKLLAALEGLLKNVGTALHEHAHDHGEEKAREAETEREPRAAESPKLAANRAQGAATSKSTLR